MNVLFLTRSYYPNIGGVEKHIYKLSKVLVDRGIRVTIITEKSHSNDYQSKYVSAKDPGKININIIEINAGKENWLKKFRIWRELLSYTNLINKSDVVHCHDVYFWYIPFRFLFPFKKNFVTFHGYEGNNLPTLKAIIMHKISETLSNGNICVGRFLEKWYKTIPTYITYGAVDNRIFNKSRKIRLYRGKGIFIGRLEYETGILEYLKAIKVLDDRGTKIIIDVYGKGSLEKRSIKYVNDNKLPVNFKGFVRDVESLLPNYDFALVSRYLGILEAMAVKLPIVAHYNNAIKEDYLKMSPFAKWIYISNNPIEIARQVRRLTKLKSDNTGKAFAWVRENTWDSMANVYLGLWGISNIQAANPQNK